MAERNFQSWHPVLGVRSMKGAVEVISEAPYEFPEYAKQFKQNRS